MTTITSTDPRLERLRAYYGNGETRTSEWIPVTQEAIDGFAEVTRDPDWMHIDPERARRDGPFDGTIAFGFWTLSMLTHFSRTISGGEYPPEVAYGFNYGLDRVRLMEPVPVGSRIRCHTRLLSLEPKGTGRYLARSENTVEIEGVEKPAMVAVWLGMLVCADPAES